MSWTLLSHLHTRRSFDSRARPEAIVSRAVQLGIDVIAVTDHDTWRGSVDVMEVASRTGAPLRVVIASEVATLQGDVIGLFLRDDLHIRNAPELCDRIHEHGGLVLLPHPYRWHRLDEALLSRVDLIEVFNAHSSRAANAKAVTLAEQRGLPALVGPDAHRVGELGNARNEFEGELPADEADLKHALLHGPRQFHTAYASDWDEWRSQLVKFTKRPNVKLAWGLARGAARRLIKPGEPPPPG